MVIVYSRLTKANLSHSGIVGNTSQVLDFRSSGDSSDQGVCGDVVVSASVESAVVLANVHSPAVPQSPKPVGL